MRSSALLFSFILTSVFAYAQDTTWVQTFSFDDISKRRGDFVLPEKDDYRKILMYYTLKCDPKTQRDNYNCGEWDYLSYNFLYDHKATFDSTAQSRVNYLIDNKTPDEFSYTTRPQYDKYRRIYSGKIVEDSIAYSKISIGSGTESSNQVIAGDEKSSFAQYIWKESELSAAGMTAGKLSGIKWNVLQGGKVDVLTIKIKETTKDSIDWESRDSVGFTTVYNRPTILNKGWESVLFSNLFEWAGTDNLIIQIEAEMKTPGQEILIEVEETGKKIGIGHKVTQGVLDFKGRNGYLNFGKKVQVDGNQSRTVEMWAKARSFNDGGLFQAGNTGSTLKDWSLRTNSSDNSWRIQLWGQDGDATLADSKNEWNHYALVYDGSATILYYNGNFVRQKKVGLETPDRDFWLGRWNGKYFDGQIDQLRIWEDALTVPELKQVMNSVEVEQTFTKYAMLRAIYGMNRSNGTEVSNDLNGKYKGVLHGDVSQTFLPAYDDYRIGTNLTTRPNIKFEKGQFTYRDTTFVEDMARLKRGKLLIKFENQSPDRIIPEWSKKHPKIPTDSATVWQAGLYNYLYDAKTGVKIDSTLIDATSKATKETKRWYSSTVKYEIGRYITPYGINLSLGSKGFTWIYDVTDYAPLLHDSIDMAAGNQQELIDLRFAFIKGKPTHEVKKIDKIWNQGSYSYRSMDDDSRLSEQEMDLEKDAETFVVKTRLTGHGHQSNDGEFPHCCEWKDNTHYLMVDGTQIADWHIWREDCDLNPVYPQGGNWVGAREGWCPGDVVGDYDFNITPNVSGSKVKIDYDITDVPANNQGMGSGNYVVAMQLFQYGAANYSTDASIEMVMRPNDWEYYQRINPACESPLIKVKNTGSDVITSMEISYQVAGGTKETYTWSGSLDFLETTEIELPISGSSFWIGDENPVFVAEIEKVNGSKDQNDENNKYSTAFSLPEIIEDKAFYIQLKTNNLPEENRYEIRDALGNIVYQQGNFSAQTLYRDSLELPQGCYTLEFFDEGFGLDYWAYAGQGSGTLQLRYVEGGVIKNFNPDFGERIYWPFAVGGISTILNGEYRPKMSVYPNPSNGQFTVELQHVNSAYTIEVYSMTGQKINQIEGKGNGINTHQIDLEEAAGIYLIQVKAEGNIYRQKVLKQ